MVKKFVLELVLLVIVIAAGFYITLNPNALTGLSFLNKNISSGQSSTSNTNPNLKTKQIKIIGSDGTNKAAVQVEIADTASARAQGLGNRDKLLSDSGMLFVFDQSNQYKFWMKGMRFPLDIIWIQDDTIADIITDVPKPDPNTPDNSLQIYAPTVSVNRVLEVNTGYIRSHGIVVGDKLVETQ
jgi:uncharacterized protein